MIPVLDRADVIGRAVAAVLAQTFADHEVVVVDRGSSDATQDAVRAVADRRVRIIERPGVDWSTACSDGLRATRSHWVTVLDPDDEVAPGWLARLGRVIDANDPEVVSCGGEQVHPDGSMSRILPEAVTADGSTLIDRPPARETDWWRVEPPDPASAGPASPGTARPPADEDAQLHRDIRSGWEVETEHYTIRTNHSLEAGVQLGVKLEQLYLVWKQLFIRYFATEAQVTALFDGRARSNWARLPRHQVVYFRSRDDYNQALRSAFPNIEMSIGVYVDSTRRAYFFAGEKSDRRTLSHEATHQLFHESRPVAPDVGLRSNFWIVEGIALYMESLHEDDGFYVLGGFDDLRMLAARYRLLHDDFYVPLADLETEYVLAHSGPLRRRFAFRNFRIGTSPWLMLSVLMIVLGVQFLMMGLLGELLTRTYHEAQQKPIYTVRRLIEAAPARVAEEASEQEEAQ